MSNLAFSPDEDGTMNLQVVPLLIKILKCQDNARQRIVLSIFARICTGLGYQTQFTLYNSILPAIIQIVQTEENVELLKQAMWVLVSLSGNPRVDHRKLIGSGVFVVVRRVLQLSADEQVQTAASGIVQKLQRQSMRNLRSFL